jgi:hypothetical protein
MTANLPPSAGLAGEEHRVASLGEHQARPLHDQLGRQLAVHFRANQGPVAVEG